VELVGELQGDPSKALACLEAAMKNTETLVISCKRLVRVDFSAAGSILNCVANGEAMGCQIEFRDVPCLVATFFNLIGINEHAQVMSRKN
jgi:ABC-type transporter Mla MlaB component